MYLYISSKDSIEYYPGNKSSSFSSRLYKELDLDEKDDWRMILHEITFVPLFKTKRPKFIEIRCDLVKESNSNGSYVPVLRRFHLRTNKKITTYCSELDLFDIRSSLVTVKFKDKFTVKCNPRNSLRYMTFNIYDENRQLVSFTKNEVYMTIELEKFSDIYV